MKTVTKYFQRILTFFRLSGWVAFLNRGHFLSRGLIIRLFITLRVVFFYWSTSSAYKNWKSMKHQNFEVLMLSSSLSFGRFFENHSPFWEKGRKFPWFLTSQLSSFLARPTSDVDSRANMGGRGDWWCLMGPPLSEKNATAIIIFSRDILPFILFLYFLCVLFRCCYLR